MRQTVKGPIVVRRVEIVGPAGTSFADLLLDTGAALTMLSPLIVESAGYDVSTAKSKQQIITGNGAIKVPILTVSELRVGDLRVDNFSVCVHSIPEVAHIQGLLGLDFLKRFRTVIDYPNGFMEITFP